MRTGERGDGWRAICPAQQSIQGAWSTKKAQQKSKYNLRPSRNSRTVSHVLRKGAKAKLTSSFWRGILSGHLSTGLQSIQRIGSLGQISRKLKSIITLSEKLRKSYKPLIVRECSYSIYPHKKAKIQEDQRENERKREQVHQIRWTCSWCEWRYRIYPESQ